MTGKLVLGLLAAVVATSGCKKDERKGLPPAKEWQADKSKTDDTTATGPEHSSPGGSNPHAGLGIPAPSNMGNNPHGDMSMGNNPHGNMAPGGQGGQIPARKADPKRTLAGVITISPKVKDKLPPGARLFLYAKRWDPKTNKMSGGTIVSQVFDSYAFPLKFKIDETNAMSGAPLTGTVVLAARLDADKDAMSRQKGDVVGRLKVKVPNLKLNLVLDTVLDKTSSAGSMN